MARQAVEYQVRVRVLVMHGEIQAPSHYRTRTNSPCSASPNVAASDRLAPRRSRHERRRVLPN